MAAKPSLASRLFQHGREIASDVLVLGGIGAMVYGVAQVYPPAAWALAGLLGAAYGILLERRT